MTTTARRPVLLVGNGARTAGAAALVAEYAHLTHTPVLTTMNAVDLAQDDLHIGFIGTYGNRAANMILDQADLVIAVGARLGLRQIGHLPGRFAPQARLIRADVDPAELSRDVKEGEEKHLTDAADFMRGLLAGPLPDHSRWLERCMEAARRLDGLDDTEGNRAVKAISALLPESPVVAVDVGQHQCWCAQSLHLRGHNGRILLSGGYGSMGCSLPYSVGASIAQGRCYCITGDGGLQMNIQELQAVAAERLPVKILVLNNRVLGKISEIQQGSYGGRFAQTTAASGYMVPDFRRVAEAYGLRAATLASYSELESYRTWLDDDLPCLLDIMLPPDTLLIPKIKWETGRIEPPLPPELEEEIKLLLQ